jgi:hypothetical protein
MDQIVVCEIKNHEEEEEEKVLVIELISNI